MRRERVALTSVRTFEAAARHLSVRGAAAELCVTPGAVSQQVIQLEAWLGAPLFVRAGRRLTLTPEGSLLATRLGTALDQVDDAIREVRQALAPSVLRLRMAPTFAIRWLMPRLADFSARFPEFEVEVSTIAGQGNRPVLEGVDFAIRVAHVVDESEDTLLIFRDAFVPVCAPAFAAQLRAPQDLAKVPLLHSMMRAESWRLWIASANVDLDADVGPRFANAELAYQAAARGVGVAVAQLEYVQADIDEGRLARPFEHVATSQFGYYLVSASHKRDLPKMRAFRGWVVDQIASH
jgi:LysR family glycine cleavage system transcriptional activator